VDCSLIDSELVGFHFGTLSPDERARVEEHLPDCARCVRAYLQIKQSVEAGVEGARPSDLLRARIRRSMESELARRQKAPARRWWVGGAAAVAAAAALLLFLQQRGEVTNSQEETPTATTASPSPGSSGHGVVDDSARVVSLNVL
jgi:anti-sigma factor RsiW